MPIDELEHDVERRSAAVKHSDSELLGSAMDGGAGNRNGTRIMATNYIQLTVRPDCTDTAKRNVQKRLVT